MKQTIPELFLYFASYSGWGSRVEYATGLFQAFGVDLVPQKFDDREPPRRVYSGGNDDIRFWMAKKEEEWGRWLHIRHKSNPHRYHGVLQWMDLSREPMASRGDYHSFFMTATTINPERFVTFWRTVCVKLHPFHAFLDTKVNYNRRAHDVAVSGQVSKNTGWYLERLPGFFSHNYFGTVYLRRWREAVEHLPASIITPDANGLFVSAPSGLDLEGRMSDVYSPDDNAIIQTLGPEWFHLPDQPDRVHAPPLEEFLVATPQPQASE